MILLITKSVPEIRRAREVHPNIGRLVQPRHYSSMIRMEGIPWAADNDGFNGFKPEPFRKMLRAISRTPEGCLFVAAPDVVGDSEETYRMFRTWGPEIGDRYGLPVGFVLQDGATTRDVPWSVLEAVFIGGTTEWKLSPEAAWLAREAKDRGKWVHMGRVNSQRRMKYAASIGVDSVDGSKYAKFFDTWLREGATWANSGQLALDPTEAPHE